MKKLILACLSIMVLGGLTAFGQGQIIFANTSTTLITNQTTGAPITGSLGWRIGLYIGADGNLTPSTYSLVAVATNSGLSAGRFSYPASPLILTGNNGEPIQYQIRVWQLSAGTTYENSLAGTIKGVSPIGRVIPATGATGAPTLFGAAEFVGQLTSGFVVSGVPEPSSIALGLLGLGAIALFRRRK